jgi:hypothetical protein
MEKSMGVHLVAGVGATVESAVKSSSSQFVGNCVS